MSFLTEALAWLGTWLAWIPGSGMMKLLLPLMLTKDIDGALLALSADSPSGLWKPRNSLTTLHFILLT